MVESPASCAWSGNEDGALFLCFQITWCFCEPLNVGHETISSWEPSGTAALENGLESVSVILFWQLGGLVFILHSKQREFTEGLGRKPTISQKASRTHRLMLQKKTFQG